MAMKGNNISNISNNGSTNSSSRGGSPGDIDVGSRPYRSDGRQMVISSHWYVFILFYFILFFLLLNDDLQLELQ
jgi:hypothetical protein